MAARKILLVAAIIFLLAAGLSAAAVVARPEESPVLKAVRVDKGPHVDGRLDDEVWKQAVAFAAFLQAEPKPGSPPSERTEARVLYDTESLYIGVLCHDSEPARIAANTMAHDADDEGENEDNVKVLLDPFQDKRNAYIFFVNPRGARSEGLAFGEHPSLDWDGIWEAKARLLADGWSVEIQIPFKTISFNARLATWGINIERYIARKQEVIRASGVSLDSFFFNPNEAAPLEGIANVKQGSGFTVRPYGVLSANRIPDGGSGTEEDLDGGLDIYKNITPNFVGAFSYNTDFAETEVDERRINLTRFPLYFPEKRTFFLEGSEHFSFGTSSGGMGSSSSFIPFFSRRVGLFGGEQVPILFGAKLFGRLGRTNISVLDVRTRPFHGRAGNDLPGQNFVAGRIYQNIWEQSRVGFIFTYGNPGGSGRNSLAGVDFRYSTSRLWGDKNLVFDAWAVYNWTTASSGRKHGFGARLDYPNDLWDNVLSYSYYGDALDPGLGFLSRNGVQALNVRSSYMPRPKDSTLVGDLVRQFFLRTSGQFYWALDGRLETRTLSFTPEIQFESGDKVEGSLSVNRDVLPFDFEVSDGVVLSQGPYNYTNGRIGFESAPYRPYRVEFNRHFGEFYSGRYSETEVEVALKYKGYATLGVATTFVRGRLPQGNFSENVYEVKADFYFSPDLGLLNYIQYDDVSHKLGVQSRFRWRISPGNEIFFVYSKNWERRWDPLSRFVPLGERGVFKVQLTIRP